MRALLLVLLLAGCATAEPPQKVVIPEYHYLTRKATPELKKLPPYPVPLDISRATQLDLAQWIIATETRMYQLELQVKRLIGFYEQDPTSEEKAAAATAAASAASR